MKTMMEFVKRSDNLATLTNVPNKCSEWPPPLYNSFTITITIIIIITTTVIIIKSITIIMGIMSSQQRGLGDIFGHVGPPGVGDAPKKLIMHCISSQKCRALHCILCTALAVAKVHTTAPLYLMQCILCTAYHKLYIIQHQLAKVQKANWQCTTLWS